MTNKIYYVNSACGSGKTYSSIQYLLNRKLNCNNFILTYPTIKLAEEVLKDYSRQLMNKGYKVKILNSKKSAESIAEKVVMICNSNPKNVILLITHEAFRRLPSDSFFFDKFELIQDEKITSFNKYELYIPKSINWIKDFISLEDDSEPWSKLIISDKKLYNNFINNSISDETEKVIRELLIKIREEIIFTKTSNWMNLISGDITPAMKGKAGYEYDYLTRSKINTNNKLYFLELLSPKKYLKFRKATIMSAFLDEDSVLFTLWKNQFNIEFEENTDISRSLRKLTNKIRVNILYHIESNYSKYFGETESYKMSKEKSVSNSEEFLNIAKDYFNSLGKEFIYFSNSSTPDCLSGIRLSGNPYGINIYSHINCITLTSHVMFPPVIIEGLEWLGLTEDMINELDNDNYYQAVYRTSIRDINSTEEVHVILPSVEKAITLVERITSTTLHECRIGMLKYKIKQDHIKVNGEITLTHRSYSDFSPVWKTLAEIKELKLKIFLDRKKRSFERKLNYQKKYREENKEKAKEARLDKYYSEKDGIKYPFPVIDKSLLCFSEFNLYDSEDKLLISDNSKPYEIFTFLKAIVKDSRNDKKFYFSFGKNNNYLVLKFDKSNNFKNITEKFKFRKIYNVTFFDKKNDCYLSYIPLTSIIPPEMYQKMTRIFQKRFDCEVFNSAEKFSLPEFNEEISVYFPRSEHDFLTGISEISSRIEN